MNPKEQYADNFELALGAIGVILLVTEVVAFIYLIITL